MEHLGWPQRRTKGGVLTAAAEDEGDGSDGMGMMGMMGVMGC